MTQQEAMQGAASATATPTKPRRQRKVGRVISNKMNKTIVVEVEALKRHRIYKRTYRQTKHFYAHDENNSCQIGDTVLIEESRPLSKLKRWRLIEIVKRGSGVVPVSELEAEPSLETTEETTEEEEQS